MAIKDVSFTIRVPLAKLLQLVVEENVGMKVDVFGDAPRAGQVPALSRPKDVPKGWQALLMAFMAKPDHKLRNVEMKQVFVAIGLSPSSISPQIDALLGNNWIVRIGPAYYRLTASGITKAKELRNGA